MKHTVLFGIPAAAADTSDRPVPTTRFECRWTWTTIADRQRRDHARRRRRDGSAEWNPRHCGANSVIVPFSQVAGSKVGELSARFDIVLDYTPNESVSATRPKLVSVADVVNCAPAEVRARLVDHAVRTNDVVNRFDNAVAAVNSAVLSSAGLYQFNLTVPDLPDGHHAVMRRSAECAP